ncbi:MAG: hypothetical protein MUC81_08450 [Bacteroidia bacterium]|jgi:hypothetical protein|nr:hypothetical protein [Bacteroidia bacterium]
MTDRMKVEAIGLENINITFNENQPEADELICKIVDLVNEENGVDFFVNHKLVQQS